MTPDTTLAQLADLLRWRGITSLALRTNYAGDAWSASITIPGRTTITRDGPSMVDAVSRALSAGDEYR